MKQSKYKNKKVLVDGIKFDSKAEAEYYIELKVLKNSGDIKDFTLQPKFVIQDAFKSERTGHIRAITYKADFLIHRIGEEQAILVVDVKGQATTDAKMKRKMFIKRYPEFILSWQSKSIKHGTDGWIDYFELEKIRRENRKKKDK